MAAYYRKPSLTLQEDLQRGYFDDFKELKDTGGKLWRAPDRLIPEDAAQPFPDMRASRFLPFVS